jgi:protein-L-isoaspartate O-methyltransferase
MRIIHCPSERSRQFHSLIALMLEALELKGTERVLEVGTGSGYAGQS